MDLAGHRGHLDKPCFLCLHSRRQFWLDSNRFLARLYTSPLVTVAAIRGEGMEGARDMGAPCVPN